MVYTPHPYFEDPRFLKFVFDLFEQLGYDKVTVDEAATMVENGLPRVLARLDR